MAWRGADVFVIGNVVSRGNPLMEAILDAGRPYLSGPQWLYENVLRDKWVLVVAGTHGKTTTTSLLTWVFEHNGLNPSYLIGGIPNNLGQGARFTDSEWFIIEGDEYDTAFFDKRSKFVHYLPEVAIINNLEFDHADIFPDLEAIRRLQPFHPARPAQRPAAGQRRRREPRAAARRDTWPGEALRPGRGQRTAVRRPPTSGSGRRRASSRFRAHRQLPPDRGAARRHNVRNALAVVAAAQALRAVEPADPVRRSTPSRASSAAWKCAASPAA